MPVNIPIPKEKLKAGGGGLLDTVTFGSISKQNCFIETRNVVLSGELAPGKLAEIESGYGLRIAEQFAKELRQLLEEVVYHLAVDGKFDNEEKAYLALLIKLFKIPRTEFEPLYRTAITRAFTDEAKAAVDDGRIDQHEWTRLEEAAKGLGLSTEDRNAVIRDAGLAVLRRELDAMKSDGMISDSDWDRFVTMADRLRISITNLGEVEQSVELYRERWRVICGSITPCKSPGIALESGESVYFIGSASWYENRKVRPSGSTVSLDRLVLITQGDLYLTNQRLVFLGYSSDNKSILWREM